MGNDNIKETVKKFITEELLFGQDVSLTDTTPLISGEILDSITFLRLAVFLEEQFEIDVEPHEITVDNLDTLNMVAEFVRARQ